MQIMSQRKSRRSTDFPAQLRSLLEIGAVTLALLASVPAIAAEKTIDKKFAASAGGTLSLQTDAGSVLVTGNKDSKEVSVHITLKGPSSALDKFEVTTEGGANGVTIVGRRTTSAWFDWSWIFGDILRVSYTIQVPREYRVTLTTSGGNLELHGLKGTVSARTSGGDVRVGDIEGDMDLRTSGGEMRGDDLAGIVRLRTSGGDILIEKAHGELDARTSGGNVRLRDIDAKLSAHTSGGNVEAELLGINRGVELGTSGGNIDITVPRTFAADVNAATSGGDVACDLPVTTTGVQDQHHREISGTINGGGQPLITRTSGGDIHIRAGL